ncbi:hypothetical protein LBMAG42_37420 [Deltaproteobacteria bacterium]|nr:hypothetical protein LBMAG42_37420 [Deltaproteobacteria bacterium]
MIGDLFGLDALERAVLQFVATLAEDSGFNKFACHAGEYAMAQAHTLVAMCAMQPEGDVRRVLAPSGRLVSSGLVSLQERACSVDDRFSFKQGLGDLLTMPALTADVFTRHFLPEAKATHLAITDFAHMHAEVSTVRAILGAAVVRRQRGVNALLVGPTGTGKSAPASLIARELGVRLHAAGIADSDGDAASPRERLSSLLLGQRLFGGGDGILVFDEFEDLFQRSSRTAQRRAPPRADRGAESGVWPLG